MFTIYWKARTLGTDMLARPRGKGNGERSPWPTRGPSPTIDTMTNTDDTPTPQLTPEEEAERAQRHERQGWFMLTGVFVGAGLLVVLAAIVT